MIILTDNDIIHKLCCCDLLVELLQLLESPPNEIWVIPTMKFKVRSLLKNDNASLARFNAFITHIRDIPVASTESLDRFVGLDVGEQALFAVFVENSNNARIVTGDKRAISDVVKICQNDNSLEQLLAGKVDCFENIMLGLIDMFGFEAINLKVTNNKGIDKVLAVIFGNTRNEEHARDALNSYINSLKTEASFI